MISYKAVIQISLEIEKIEQINKQNHQLLNKLLEISQGKFVYFLLLS